MAGEQTERFRAFEHTGWEQAHAEYDAAFRRLTTQVVPALLDAAVVELDTRVLDVCSGPGYVAAAAQGRGAMPIGVDFSALMVERARDEFPTIDFRVGDAEQLSFPESAFDAVVMNFGLMHLGRPERAIEEAARVLRSGGRFAMTVWAAPPRTVGFDIVLRAIAEHGEIGVDLPEGPDFFLYTDADVARQSFDDAGFEEPSIREVPQMWSVTSGEQLFRAFRDGTVRTAGLLRAQSESRATAIHRAIVDAVTERESDGSVELAMPALLISGRKR